MIISHSWLVGGPARCGKSALAGVLAGSDAPLAILRVDALMHVYRKTPAPTNTEEKRAFLAAYLNRPRYMNPEKTEVLRPIDDFPVPLDEVLDGFAIPSGNVAPTGLIENALDEMARLNGKTGWLALDLHPELHYRSYRKSIPGLKLIILLRDPFEAIAASLYWRTFPERRAQAGCYLSYATFLWCLSALTGAALKRDFPDDVHIISSNDLFTGKAGLPEKIAGVKGNLQRGFSTMFNDDPYFTYDKNTGCFLCPDGSWRPLLSPREIMEIGHYRDNLWPLSQLGKTHFHDFQHVKNGLDGLLYGLASYRPELAKRWADNLYFPAGVPRRALERMKTLLRKVIIK